MERVYGMKKNEVVLTEEIFKKIVEEKTKEIIDLKKGQEEYANKISTELEILNQLKKELKQLKGNIRGSKRNLKLNKIGLNRINRNLEEKSGLVIEVNSKFKEPEEQIVDLAKFFPPKVKKKR